MVRIGGPMKSIGLVAAYFNPCGFERPRLNCLRFVESLGELRERLTIVELVLDQDRYLEIPGVNMIYVKGKRPAHFMWQKEALLNYGMTKVPQEFDCVAWLDSDIKFESKDWITRAETALEQYAVVQLFSVGNHLDKRGRLAYNREGVIYHARTAEFSNRTDYGLAWAGRRFHVENKLIDWCITGNADTFMAEGWLGLPATKRSSRPMYAAYQNWMDGNILQDRVHYIDGEVTHFYHGRKENRRYSFRTQLLIQHNFDPTKDIIRDGEIYKWSGRNPNLENGVIQWFRERREDE